MRFHFMCHPTQLAHDAPLFMTSGEFQSQVDTGRELFYIAADSTLMAVAVAGRGSQFEVGAALPLFHTNPSYVSSAFSYDVSADGNRFIVSTAAPEKIAPITLVENWLSDFKK